MKHCIHFVSTTSSALTCKIHGIVPITQCSGCADFSMRSRGLGDTIHKGLAKIGITEQRVSQAIKKPCKCDGRRNKLNELFPYKSTEDGTSD